MMSGSRMAVAALVGQAVVCGVASAQELQQDPSLVTGHLENGLEYIVMHHATPPGRAAAWMHVHAGSLRETESQRGLAHFLEHMAFNGSENFPPGTVVKYFESIGMTFGRDQNAFTNFDQTTYQLSLPDNRPETLSRGLLFFSDVCFRLLLDPGEVEAERGVILNEKTSRSGVQQRLGDFMIERMAPGSLYSRRNVIGTDETLRAVKREDFVDYYTKWYGPGNTTLIVVADMDPAVVVEQIRAQFETGRATTRAPEVDPGIRAYERSFGVVFADPELTRCSVGVMTIDRAGPPVRTEAQQRTEWVEDLAQAAFNRRLSDLIARGEMPFRSAGVAGGQQGRLMRTASATATGQPEKWREMLAALVTEVQRARVHGLTQEELDQARSDILASFDQAARTEKTMPASGHLARLNNAVASGRVAQSAAQRLELARRLLPGISPEEASRAFSAQFDFSRAMFSLQIPSTGDVPGEEEVLSVGMKALTAPVEPREGVSHARALMEELPTPGRVVEEAVHEASRVWSAWMENGVRVHHRFMDERKDSVWVSITLLGGELDETAANRGITQAAAVGLGASGPAGGRSGRAAGQPATRKLSSTDIRALLSGKNVRVSARAGLDAVQLSVSGTPEDLETGMQLVHLLLTEPLIEAVAFERWKEGMLQSLAGVDKNPLQAFGKAEAEARFPPGEVRTKMLTPEQVSALTLAAAQERLERIVAASPIEVAVVGDISREQARLLVARYLGSLRPRARVEAGAFAELRRLPAPTGPREARVEVDTMTDQAGASVGFYGPDQGQVEDVRVMMLASQILSSRMVKEIREEKALVYSIRCGLSPGTTFAGYGMVRAGAPCRPENAEALGPAVREVFERFAKEGPTEEEVATARLQARNTLDEARRNPSTWLGLLETLTYDGRSLDDFMADPEAYEAITSEDVRRVFEKYYTPDRLVTVMVRPRVKPGG
jgi:zinc protease